MNLNALFYRKKVAQSFYAHKTKFLYSNSGLHKAKFA